MRIDSQIMDLIAIVSGVFCGTGLVILCEILYNKWKSRKKGKDNYGK